MSRPGLASGPPRPDQGARHLRTAGLPGQGEAEDMVTDAGAQAETMINDARTRVETLSPRLGKKRRRWSTMRRACTPRPSVRSTRKRSSWRKGRRTVHVRARVPHPLEEGTLHGHEHGF